MDKYLRDIVHAALTEHLNHRTTNELKVMAMELERLPLSDIRGMVSEVVERMISHRTEIPRLELKDLKKKGDKMPHKPYGAPVTNISQVGSWVISYEHEHAFVKVQPTLAISHTDRIEFTLDQFELDMPFVWEVFNKPVATFTKEYVNRGFTLLCVLGE